MLIVGGMMRNAGVQSLVVSRGFGQGGTVLLAEPNDRTSTPLTIKCRQGMKWKVRESNSTDRPFESKSFIICMNTCLRTWGQEFGNVAAVRPSQPLRLAEQAL